MTSPLLGGEVLGFCSPAGLTVKKLMVVVSREHMKRKQKIPTCDGCGKEHRSVCSRGVDANGDPDAPDYCFICFKEAQRGRFFNKETGKYVRVESDYPEYSE